MERHLTPKPLVIAERYKFHKRNQEEGQSIREFLAKLQKLTETCEFGTYRNKVLRERLVCSINSKVTRRRRSRVEFTESSRYCCGDGANRERINQFSNDKQVNKVESQECFRCGKQNHSPDKCFHKNAECHICKKKGHKYPEILRGKGATSKDDSTKSALQNKSTSKKKRKDAKFKKKEEEFYEIKFVDIQDEVSSESEVLQMRKTIPIVIGLCLLCHTFQGERPMKDAASKIIHQISASTKMQNAIFARKRDINTRRSRKGRELLPKKTLQSLHFKISPNRRRRAKMLNLRKRREIS